MEGFMEIEFMYLIELRIETNKFKGEDVEHFCNANLPKIKVLKINNSRFGDKGAEFIAKSTTL